MTSTLGSHDLRQSIHHLKNCISALRVQYGEADSIRRLDNDLQRLEIDAHDFESSRPQQLRPPPPKPDVVYVPDSKSDEQAWLGAQDEGLGFHSRRRTL